MSRLELAGKPQLALNLSPPELRVWTTMLALFPGFEEMTPFPPATHHPQLLLGQFENMSSWPTGLCEVISIC